MKKLSLLLILVLVVGTLTFSQSGNSVVFVVEDGVTTITLSGFGDIVLSKDYETKEDVDFLDLRDGKGEERYGYLENDQFSSIATAGTIVAYEKNTKTFLLFSVADTNAGETVKIKNFSFVITNTEKVVDFWGTPTTMKIIVKI